MSSIGSNTYSFNPAVQRIGLEASQSNEKLIDPLNQQLDKENEKEKNDPKKGPTATFRGLNGALYRVEDYQISLIEPAPLPSDEIT